MAWYNKYRPQIFADVYGQKLIKTVLQNTVKTINSSNPKVKHAYLFSGPRGTGKTSMARIFARSINCLDLESGIKNGEACGVCNVCLGGSIDIIELDAASNTGIDNIRDLIEASNVPPFISRYKVYIIDEVHMLSKAAMNALLKTLEEPPSYLVFLMATTDPEKIIPTILSRLTELKLTNHTTADILDVLKEIAKKEEVAIDENALKLIAKQANGGLRDAVNLLETVSNYNLDYFDQENVAKILGILPKERLQELTAVLSNGNQQDLKAQIEIFETEGVDPQVLLTQLLDFLLSNVLENLINDSKFDNKYNNLIEALESILSSKYTLSSILTALVLVKIKANKDNFVAVENSELKKKPEPVNESKSQIQEPLFEPAPAVSTLLQENYDKLQKFDDSSYQLCNFTQEINNQLGQGFGPGLIKTFSESLWSFKKGYEVCVYLPNKTFIAPLKSVKTVNWLTDLAKTMYGINTIVRIADASEDDFFKTLTENTQKNTDLTKPNSSNEEKPTIVAQTPKTLNTLSNADNINEEFEVSDFYSLYSLPKEGSVSPKMRMYKKPNFIPETKLETNSNSVEWQEAISGFDFE